MRQPVENTVYCPNCTAVWGLEEPAFVCPRCRLSVPRDFVSSGQTREPSLWDRILEMVEQDLTERRSRKLFVEVQGESGPCRKEIGELSETECRSLHPALRERVLEQLLDRHLAEQGCLDLVERRRTYTKKIQDLTPEDLPALVEADRWRAEEEHKQAKFAQEVRADLERLLVTELAEMTEAGNEVQR